MMFLAASSGWILPGSLSGTLSSNLPWSCPVTCGLKNTGGAIRTAIVSRGSHVSPMQGTALTSFHRAGPFPRLPWKHAIRALPVPHNIALCMFSLAS